MIFRFKQFDIKHSDSLLKVNTDAVLLGALCGRDQKIKSILEIGTGCGVIALMAAQIYPGALIDAIEIDPNSSAEAQYNFMNSKFSERLNAHEIALQEFKPGKKYDFILSNPPYFEVPDFSIGNNQQDIKITRKKLATQFTLTFEELLLHSSELLNPNGKLIVIIPNDSKDAFEKIALKNNLYLQREIFIRSKPGNPFIRCVLSFGFEKVNRLNEEIITIYNPDGSRHDEYIALTKEFYL